MDDDFTSRFMRALAEAATERMGAEHAFVGADLTNARRLLDQLDLGAADALLAAIHKRLREDVVGAFALSAVGRPTSH